MLETAAWYPLEFRDYIHLNAALWLRYKKSTESDIKPHTNIDIDNANMTSTAAAILKYPQRQLGRNGPFVSAIGFGTMGAHILPVISSNLISVFNRKLQVLEHHGTAACPLRVMPLPH